MREEYRESTVPFLEKEGRLLFLTFLKPIINGVGFYYVEPQTRDNRRMDLVVTYERQEFIVELKIWRGENTRRAAATNSPVTSPPAAWRRAILSPSTSPKTRSLPSLNGWMEWNGKRIFEVIV